MASRPRGGSASGKADIRVARMERKECGGGVEEVDEAEGDGQDDETGSSCSA
jgi:hypothetical protein